MGSAETASERQTPKKRSKWVQFSEVYPPHIDHRFLEPKRLAGLYPPVPNSSQSRPKTGAELDQPAHRFSSAESVLLPSHAGSDFGQPASPLRLTRLELPCHGPRAVDRVMRRPAVAFAVTRLSAGNITSRPAAPIQNCDRGLPIGSPNLLLIRMHHGLLTSQYPFRVFSAIRRLASRSAANSDGNDFVCDWPRVPTKRSTRRPSATVTLWN
jgi:hypothetical protein